MNIVGSLGNAQCYNFEYLRCVRGGFTFTPARTSRHNPREAPNDLENSENCRSAGGHGNQHVRLRSAQTINCIGTICPVPEASFCFEPRQGVRSERQNSGACPACSVLCETLASLKLFINQPALRSVCVSVMPPSNVFGVERVKLRGPI